MMFWPFFGFGQIWMLAVIVGVVLLIVWAARQGSSGSSSGSSRTRALDVLDERFARGEIDEEEYRKRRRALEGS